MRLTHRLAAAAAGLRCQVACEVYDDVSGVFKTSRFKNKLAPALGQLVSERPGGCSAPTDHATGCCLQSLGHSLRQLAAWGGCSVSRVYRGLILDTSRHHESPSPALVLNNPLVDGVER